MDDSLRSGMMRRVFQAIAGLAMVLAIGSEAMAQVSQKKDPLASSAQANAAGCSTTDASSCAQAAAKIIPQVMGPSPLEENLRRLTDEVGGRVSGSSEMAKAVDWAVAAFRAE